jgi:hypothetical protein
VKGDSCVSLWWGYVVHCPGKSVKLFTAILSYFVAFLGIFFFGWGRGTGVWVWSFWLWFEEFWVFWWLKAFCGFGGPFLGGALQLLWGRGEGGAVGGRVLWGSFKRWRVLRLFGGKFKALFLAFMAWLCCFACVSLS